jgi:hypothetical protein
MARPKPDWRKLPSNLILDAGLGSEAEQVTADSLVLDGAAYRYYFVRTDTSDGPEYVLVVDTKNAGALNISRLGQDLLCLQFTLGQPLEIRELVNVSPAGKAMGWQGLSCRRRETGRESVPPIPTQYPGGVEALYTIFRLATDRIADPQLRLSVPFDYYVESLYETLDGAYLKIHVALESLARRILTGDGNKEVPLVENSAEWESYVDSIAAPIRQRTRNDTDAQILVNKVKSAKQRPATSRVEDAFKKYGIMLSKDESDEIKGRNRIVHAALMSDPDNRDVRADGARVAKLRVILVRLVALAIGYNGPISGPDGSPVKI